MSVEQKSPIGSPTGTSKRIIKVVIVSDTVCPWCYIAKRRFDKAVATLDPEKVEVEWKPWFLAPMYGLVKGVTEHFRSKFGEQKGAQTLDYLVEVSKSEGINFKYAKSKLTPTLNSHRLLYWAKPQGKQHVLVEAFFQAFVENEQDLSDNEVLLDCVASVGLNRDEAKRFLATDEFASLVKTEAAEAIQKDILGVPHFIFEDKYPLSAVQDASVFINMFKKLGASGETSPKTPTSLTRTKSIERS